MGKKWNDEEIVWLKDNYSNETKEGILNKLDGRT